LAQDFFFFFLDENWEIGEGEICIERRRFVVVGK